MRGSMTRSCSTRALWHCTSLLAMARLGIVKLVALLAMLERHAALLAPASRLPADVSDDSAAYAAVGARNPQRDAKGKQIFEGVESMWSPPQRSRGSKPSSPAARD